MMTMPRRLSPTLMWAVSRRLPRSITEMSLLAALSTHSSPPLGVRAASKGSPTPGGSKSITPEPVCQRYHYCHRDFMGSTCAKSNLIIELV